MKILTSKKYKELISENENLKDRVSYLEETRATMLKDLQDSTTCSVNQGSSYCSMCAHSYPYVMSNLSVGSKFGCELAIKCREFTRSDNKF